MNNKLLGYLLLSLAFLVALGFLVQNKTCWEVLDIFLIVVCGWGGASLLRKR